MTDKKPIHAFAQAGKIRISTPLTGLVAKFDFDDSKEVNLEVAVSGERLIVPLNPKLLRRAQDALKAGAPGTIKMMLTGVLDLQAKQINRAGISTHVMVQPDTQKPDASVPAVVASVPPAPDALVSDAVEPTAIAPPAPIVIIKKQRTPEPQG